MLLYRNAIIKALRYNSVRAFLRFAKADIA
jgi:hypothetical protein